MTQFSEENLERRIVRQLDGELSASQREELSRELLRDPEARRRMASYAEADRRAGEALRAVFTRTGPAGLRSFPGPRYAPGAWRRRAVWAAAAVVLLAAGGGYLAYVLAPGDAAGPGPETPPVARKDAVVEPPAGVERLIWQVWDSPLETSAGGVPAAGQPVPAAGEDAPVPLPRIQGPRRIRRDVDRHIFRVYDETDNTVYLLGVDRVRKTVHAVGEDL